MYRLPLEIVISVSRIQIGLQTHIKCIEVDIGVLWRDLLKQVRVDLGVGDVLLEVGAAPRHTCHLQLVVHPAEKNCFG